MFEGLRIALKESLGCQPTFERLAKILNENVSTVHHWLTSQPHTHLVAFLALMERLSERKRHDLLHEYCRELPSLDNPRIAHDLLAVSGLERILGKKNGLKWICGGSEFHRTFQHLNVVTKFLNAQLGASRSIRYRRWACLGSIRLRWFEQSAEQITVPVHCALQHHFVGQHFVKQDLIVEWPENEEEAPLAQTRVGEAAARAKMRLPARQITSGFHRIEIRR